jgi:hypothetical protein
MSVWERWRHRGASEIIDHQRRSFQANGTIGYDELAWLTVTKVNRKEIKSLADLAERVKQLIKGFIKIETEEDPKQIELDAAQAATEAPVLQENYGISSLHRLD